MERMYWHRFPLYAVCAVEDENRKEDDSFLIAVGGGGGSSKTGVKNGIALLRIFDHQIEELDSFSTGPDCVTSLCSHSKKPILVCCADQNCLFLKVKDLRLSKNSTLEVKDTEKGIRQRFAIFNPNGDLLATGDDLGVVRLWEFPSLKRLHTMKDHSKEAIEGSFNPDGSLLVTCGADQCLNIYNTESSDLVHTLKTTVSHPKITFKGCSFVDDGNSIIALQCASRHPSFVTKWNVSDWMEEKTRKISAKPQTTISVSQEFAASGDPDGRMVVCRLSDLSVVSRVMAHEFFVSSICFSPNSEEVVSVSGTSGCHAFNIKASRKFSTMFLVILITLFVLLTAILFPKFS